MALLFGLLFGVLASVTALYHRLRVLGKTTEFEPKISRFSNISGRFWTTFILIKRVISHPIDVNYLYKNATNVNKENIVF